MVNSRDIQRAAEERDRLKKLDRLRECRETQHVCTQTYSLLGAEGRGGAGRGGAGQGGVGRGRAGSGHDSTKRVIIDCHQTSDYEILQNYGILTPIIAIC